MRKAIVTLAVGEKFEQLFNEYCRNNWQQYCDKFGFELIVINNTLDKSDRAGKRSLAWQKLLILSQPWSMDFEQIVWVDCDVIINSEHATDITNGVVVDKVGAIDQYSIPTADIFNLSLSRLYKSWDESNVKYIDNRTSGTYYTNRGIPGGELKEVMQGGIFICSPKHHRDIFEKIYYTYEDSSGGGNYENPAMSYELVKAGLIVWLSSRFNFCVINIISAFYPNVFYNTKSFIEEFYSRAVRKITGHVPKQKTTAAELECLKNIYDLSIFMHFAGCADLMPKMKKILK
jgi:hypothetical protein